MGEKTGVLFLIISTLVVGTIFLVVNKGSTTEIGEDIQGKMFGIVKSAKEDEYEVKYKDNEEKEVNTGSLVLKVPFLFRGYYFSEVGSPLKEISEFLEESKEDCAEYGSEYCFDVLEFDEETGEYKSLGEEAIDEIKMDTSQVNINKRGVYPVTYSYEDKETGNIYKVSATYEILPTNYKEYGRLRSYERPYYTLDNYGGKTRLTTEGGKNRLITVGGKEILLEGDIPTLQELVDNGLLSVLGLYYYDLDTKVYMELDGTEDGFEIDAPHFDKGVPGVYALNLTYTDSATGNTYELSIAMMYYVEEDEGIRSDGITRK